MRILFIRHGDPDYKHDTLTEKGVREAAALAKTAADLGIGDIFVSPMGRAMRTASYSISALSGGALTPDEAYEALLRRQRDILPGRRVEVRDSVMEFLTMMNVNGNPELLKAYPNSKPMKNPPDPDIPTLVTRYRPSDLAQFMPDADGRLPEYAPRIAWDIVPSYMADHPELFERTGWRESLISKTNDLPFYYDLVTEQFDSLLSEYGYRRDGLVYRTDLGTDRTIAVFCHLGAASVLISHLMNTSPFVFLQGMSLLTTSVSEFVTEERQKGTAVFRALRLGDISHLYMAGEKPSFAGRFCELFENEDERH